MLTSHFKPGDILHATHVADWREALDTVAAPLLADGRITPNYVEAMKTTIAAPGGTYIDLGYGVALAHSRPENGVNTTSLSVLHVNEPFNLADDPNHPITTMFCLAAEDSNAHIDLMQALAGLLTDPERLAALNAAADVEALAAVLA